jgi:protein-tyrosine phosphatase
VANFRVLVVCTANHCRSPIGQQLLAHDARKRFGERDGWLIDSAGTDIPGRWPLHPYAAAVLAERLPEVAPHESIQLTPALIGQADLVLTATRQHRSTVVSTLPAAIGRTFTILQFARLCDEVSPLSATDSAALGRELVVLAKLARSSVQPVPGEQDDLPDPMGRGVQEFRLCADRLQDSIDRILRPLALLDLP